MEPTTYFIVSTDLIDYARAIRANDLPPSRCFACTTLAEATRGVLANRRHGIPALVLRAPAWTRRHGMAERAERGAA